MKKKNKYDNLILEKGEKMLTINIICAGKIKENYLKDAIGEYSKRLSKYRW